MTLTNVYFTSRFIAEGTTTVIPAGSSPTLVIFATLLTGGLLSALVLAYKARAEKGTVVASGSEKAVLSMERSLAAMEKRAELAEANELKGRGRESALEKVLELSSHAAGNLAQETDPDRAKLGARYLADQIESALSTHRNQNGV